MPSHSIQNDVCQRYFIKISILFKGKEWKDRRRGIKIFFDINRGGYEMVKNMKSQ